MTTRWLDALRGKRLVVEREFQDAQVQGLGIRVWPRARGKMANTMSWFVRAGRGSAHGRRTIGRYPEVGLREARAKAQEHLEAPEPKMPPLPSPTVAEVARAYLNHKKRRGKITWEEDERILAKDVLGIWGHLPAREITRSMVRSLQIQIAEERDAPRAADYLVTVLSGMWRFAMGRPDLLEGLSVNPAAEIERCQENSRRERDLSWDEMAAVWTACEKEGSVAARAFQLGMLTGLRRDALLGGQWVELGKDVQAKQDIWWEVPAVRMMKGKRRGAASGEPLRIFLPPLAQHVLGLLPDETYMFPSRRLGMRLKRLEKPLYRLRHLSGIQDLRFKMLRTSFASRMAEIGVPPHIREALMGHRRTSVQEGHYNMYDYRNEKRAALKLYDNHFQDLLEVSPPVPLRLHRLLVNAPGWRSV